MREHAAPRTLSRPAPLVRQAQSPRDWRGMLPMMKCPGHQDGGLCKCPSILQQGASQGHQEQASCRSHWTPCGQAVMVAAVLRGREGGAEPSE